MENWKKQRNLFSNVFHFENLKNLVPSVEKITNSTFKNIILSKQLEK